MTLLSRVLGLVRDMVLAQTIGAQAGADAFFVAFKIPNFLRRLFAEGAFSQAFVPVLTEYRERGSHAAVQGLINRICGCLGLTLLGLSLMVMVAAPAVTLMFAPGFWQDPEKFALAEQMLRITFPYLLLISLTGFAGSILNSYDRFAAPAFTPVLLNICLISAAVWVSPQFDPPVLALAWGVLCAGVVQLSFQVPFLWKLKLLPKPTVDFNDQGVRRVLLLMLPAIFGVSVSQINLLLDTLLASFLPTGSISWLYYSDRLVELPLGTIAIAIATVILPSLARQHVGADKARFNATMDWALRLVLFIALPAALALFILAEPILYTLFGYGKTTPTDIVMSSYSLKAYALGLLAFMLIKVLAPGYFSRQDTKTPVKIGILAMVVNMVLNGLLVIPLHLVWQLGHLGLALATSLAAVVNACLLYRGLRLRQVYAPVAGWRLYLLRLFVANGVMAVVLLLASDYCVIAADQSWVLRMAYLGSLCTMGLFTYLGTLLLLGMRLRDMRMA
ncbi:MAG: murein biosynthesis integral membrane protein MurJ [Cellvibrionaceae bacterium]|nr:murein biosynthesis integral membrane protein MurJ [Cellvibrionaceae bacterium]